VYLRLVDPWARYRVLKKNRESSQIIVYMDYAFSSIYLMTYAGISVLFSDFYGFVFLSICLGTHLKMKG
jgi:hypothetical protein